MVVNVLVTIGVKTYIDELRLLPPLKNSDYDQEPNDTIYYIAFWVSVIFVTLNLVSCITLFII